jgi:hypothetical protein
VRGHRPPGRPAEAGEVRPDHRPDAQGGRTPRPDAAGSGAAEAGGGGRGARPAVRAARANSRLPRPGARRKR